MSGLFPQIEPIPVADADVPYTGKLVWLSIASAVIDNALDASVTIRTKPYRVLSDQKIELAPDSLDVALHFPSVNRAIGGDPKLAKAIVAIAGAIQEYISPSPAPAAPSQG